MFKRLLRRKKLALPERLLILLTNPRSGSTWLFDALRTHPAIDIEPEAVVFTYLGMNGRRYPRDLSGDGASTQTVEVRPGEWETLPTFTLPHTDFDPSLPRYALEKCHPHFFKHDVDSFVQKLKRLPNVRMIYQVRDPDESLLSFMRYKERNPSWNPHIGQDELPAHMRRIYESLLKCAQQYPGLVVDYTTLENDFEGSMRRIFDTLWQGGYDDALLTAIQDATRREKRSHTTFLGGSKTDAVRDKGTYTEMFQRYAQDIEACHTAYRSLLRLGEGV